jgi:hypothetical protein
MLFFNRRNRLKAQYEAFRIYLSDPYSFVAGKGVIRMRFSSTTENFPVQSVRLSKPAMIRFVISVGEGAEIRNKMTPHEEVNLNR